MLDTPVGVERFGPMPENSVDVRCSSARGALVTGVISTALRSRGLTFGNAPVLAVARRRRARRPAFELVREAVAVDGVAVRSADSLDDLTVPEQDKDVELGGALVEGDPNAPRAVLAYDVGEPVVRVDRHQRHRGAVHSDDHLAEVVEEAHFITHGCGWSRGRCGREGRGYRLCGDRRRRGGRR